jgi:uncharacterized protein YceK
MKYLLLIVALLAAGCTTTCKLDKDDDGQPQIIIMEW